MRKIFIAIAAFATLSTMTSLLSACNTTAGAGKDISATGHAITTSADKLKP
jgi:predicted small secreted protein